MLLAHRFLLKNSTMFLWVKMKAAERSPHRALNAGMFAIAILIFSYSYSTTHPRSAKIGNSSGKNDSRGRLVW
jgi:hypothetical protein